MGIVDTKQQLQGILNLVLRNQFFIILMSIIIGLFIGGWLIFAVPMNWFAILTIGLVVLLIVGTRELNWLLLFLMVMLLRFFLIIPRGSMTIVASRTVLFLAVFVWMTNGLIKRKFGIEKAPFKNVLLVYFLLSGMFFFYSTFLWGLKNASYRLEALFVFLLAASCLKTVKHLKLLIVCILIPLSFQALLGIYQFFSLEEAVHIARHTQMLKQFFFNIDVGKLMATLGLGVTRAFGTFGYPNTLAYCLGISIPLALGSTWYSRNLNLKILSFLFITLAMIAIVFTFTRATWIGIVAGIVVMSILGKKKRIILYLSVLVSAGVFILAKLPFWWSRIINQRMSQMLTVHPRRIFFWQSSWELFKEHPFIGAEEYHMIPHNMFLAQGLESGIPGIIILIILFFLAAKFSLRLFRKTWNPEAKGIALGIIGALVVLFICGIPDNPLYIYTVRNLFMLLLAMLVALGKIGEKKVHADSD